MKHEEITINEDSITIGATALDRNPASSKEYIPGASILIHTPQTIRNLEKIAQAIKLDEPLLLTGETASGKTSLIKHIAYLTGNSCLRLNLSSLTEKLEFIGGFSPNEAGILVWRDGILVKAMKQGHWLILDEINLCPAQILERLNSLLDDDRFLTITEHDNEKLIRPDEYERQKELLGSNKDRILCERDGMEYLLFDNVKIFRIHSAFRLFGTMNPAEGKYSGRKEFSPALMNRFRVKWIDELSQDDIRIIVYEKYGVDFPKWILDNALEFHHEMYIKARELSGDKVYYTIRHLQRWLNRVKTNNPRDKSGLARVFSIEAKEVYGDGLSHLSEDDPQWAIKKYLYDILAQKFGSDFQDDDIEVTTYNGKVCLGDVCFEVKDRPTFYEPVYPLKLTYSTRLFLKKIAKAALKNEPVLLIGPTSCGKTSFVRFLANLTGRHVISQDMDGQTDVCQLIGQYIPQEQSSHYKWQPGLLLQAIENGSWILIDELNLVEPEVLERINSLIDDDRSIVVTEHKNEIYIPAAIYETKLNNLINHERIDSDEAEKILSGQGFFPIHPDFRLFCAMNPENYVGRTRLSLAMLNKFTLIWVPEEQTEQEQLSIIEHYMSVFDRRN